MSIELLWIIPIVAAALIVLVVALSLQQKSEVTQASRDVLNMKRAVADFNRGISPEKKVHSEPSDARLREIENTIHKVSTMLSNQQKTIENFQGKDVTLENELTDLKKNLQELQKEYDITISENYSMRARLKKLDVVEPGTSPENNMMEDTDTIERSKVLNMKIFEDTRMIDPDKPAELDDTSEINLSELK